MNNKIKGILALLLATIIWGSAFVAQSVGMDYIGPFTFQTMRSVLAVPFLAITIFLFEKNKGEYFTRWANPKLWKAGFICGVSLFVAAGFQQLGIVYTTAGKAGFITAMYIVIVPILGLFYGKKPTVNAWISVVLAVAGLFLLSCVGVTQINIGDILVLLCAFAYAVQITLIDRLAGDLDGFRLNCVQALVCGLLSGIVMFATETPQLHNILSCWLPLGYAGILSLGIAFSLQIVGQKYVEPTPASLIMSLESVNAVFFGWLILKEVMAPHEIIGCILVFAGVILSQIPAKNVPVT